MQIDNTIADSNNADSQIVQSLYNAARAAMQHKNCDYYNAFRALCQPSVIIQLIEKSKHGNRDK